MRTIQQIDKLIDLTMQERDSYIQKSKRRGPGFRSKLSSYERDIREFIEEREAIMKATSSKPFQLKHLTLIRGGLYDQAKAS